MVRIWIKIMLETAGFEMIDLGGDVPLQKFVDTAEGKRSGIDLPVYADDNYHAWEWKKLFICWKRKVSVTKSKL